MEFLNIEFKIPLLSLFFMVLLCVVYFSKPKVKLFENKFFVVILLSTTIVTLMNTLVLVFCSLHTLDSLNTIYHDVLYYINIIMSLLLYIVSLALLMYNFYVSNNSLLNEKKVRFIYFVCSVAFIVICLFLDVDFTRNYGVTKVGGSLIDFAYYLISFNIISTFIVAYRNRSKIDNRFNAVIYMIIIILPILIISYFLPYLMLQDTIAVFITYIMFFTIENPDVKIIEKLTYANEQIEKANRAKTDFLSNMSHEIRTPLNAIIGFAHCIKEEEDPKTMKEDATDIINASETLLEIVNGVLDISKIEANKMEIVETDYDLVAEMEKVCKLIIPRIGSKDINFKYNFGRDLPGRVHGDGGKLRQIVTNLLTNAVKYTTEGEISFDISGINQNGYTSLIIVVTDTGRGIKEEQVNKLFTKFNRLDEDKNTTIEGTGLGLAITKSLVELMGGKVLVHSVYNEGSKFTVYLKQKIVSMDRIVANDNSHISHNDFVNYKVLLVDDNRLNIKIAEKLLEKFGVIPESVTSGFDCIEKVKGSKYDLILLDDMMPNMSGTDTLKKLKELDGFDTPVVVLTANVLSGNDTKYKNLGFNDYLGKPIDSSELLRVLKTYYPNSTKISIRKRILLVDDNPINNKITKKILSNFDVEVETVSSGIECLDKIYKDNTKYDLIFMDDMMPEMSGVETFMKLKNDPNFTTPVVALTANAIEGSREFYITKGFNEYISKPIEMSHFKEVLKDIIGE